MVRIAVVLTVVAQAIEVSSDHVQHKCCGLNRNVSTDDDVMVCSMNGCCTSDVSHVGDVVSCCCSLTNSPAHSEVHDVPTWLQPFVFSFLEGLLDENGYDFATCLVSGLDLMPAMQSLIQDVKAHSLKKVAQDLIEVLRVVVASADSCQPALTDANLLMHCCGGPGGILKQIEKNVQGDLDHYIATELEKAIQIVIAHGADMGGQHFGNALHRMLLGTDPETTTTTISTTTAEPTTTTTDIVTNATGAVSFQITSEDCASLHANFTDTQLSSISVGITSSPDSLTPPFTDSSTLALGFGIANSFGLGSPEMTIACILESMTFASFDAYSMQKDARQYVTAVELLTCMLVFQDHQPGLNMCTELLLSFTVAVVAALEKAMLQTTCANAIHVPARLEKLTDAGTSDVSLQLIQLGSEHLKVAAKLSERGHYFCAGHQLGAWLQSISESVLASVEIV